MKHIKLFEGYLDKYYVEIDEEEWLDLLDDSDAFPEKLEARLRDLVDGEITVDDKGTLKIKTYSQSVEGSTPYWANVDSIDDDYYTVYIYSRYIDDEFWKCDQFEGLIKLLEDKGFIS